MRRPPALLARPVWIRYGRFARALKNSQLTCGHHHYMRGGTTNTLRLFKSKAVFIREWHTSPEP